MKHPTAGDQPAGQAPSDVPMSPGDDAPEGTPGTGEDICPQCGGSGREGDGTCRNCQGTGKVNVGIGGA